MQSRNVRNKSFYELESNLLRETYDYIGGTFHT